VLTERGRATAGSANRGTCVPCPGYGWPVAYRLRASPEHHVSWRWRLRHSLWLLVPVLSVGILTWAAFLYVGVRGRRPSWWIAGIVYAVALLAVFVLDETSARQPNEYVSGWGGALLLAIWVAGSLHAVIINGEWLRIRGADSTSPRRS
jgi:hypothetical protein